MPQIVDYEQLLAQAILDEIEQAIKEALATLDGGDSKYYNELYIQLQKEHEKIAELTQLPIELVRKIAALIDSKIVAGIGKELVIRDFQYVHDGNAKKTEGFEQKGDSKARRENQEKDKDQEKELVNEEQEEEELEKPEQDPENLKDLAKLAEAKQKVQAKKTLKHMLLAMIASRMDPRQRAGETAKSNVTHAQNYGRGNQLTLGQLLKAGVITKVLLHKLEAHGMSANTQINTGKVQNIIKDNSAGIFNLVKNGISTTEHGVTRIPSKGESLSVFSSVNKSLGIFGSEMQDHNKVKPVFTPFVQEVNQEQGRGRGM